MTNIFLKVNKDLFKLGLNPTEILLLAQVMEFQNNTGDCFMSDKALAEMYSVSEKTISRALSALEARGFIKRETRNIKGGRVRHITAVMSAINDSLTTDKMTLDDATTDKMSLVQQSNCPLYNGQNDLIKDKSDKEKEENAGLRNPSLRSGVTQSLIADAGAGVVPAAGEFIF